MAWSDAARQAALEARQRNSATRQRLKGSVGTYTAHSAFVLTSKAERRRIAKGLLAVRSGKVKNKFVATALGVGAARSTHIRNTLKKR